MATRKPVKKQKSAWRRTLESSKLEVCLFVVILALLIVLVVFAIKDAKKKRSGGEIAPTPYQVAQNTPTQVPPVTEEPSPSPIPDTPTPTPAPTPYPVGLCESVTTDVYAEPVPGDNWKIDYLMLVNWTHRLKYTGDPENLVRLNEVLTASFYTIENPKTVAASSRNFVIETEEDGYDRGNREALIHLNEMCTAYHDSTKNGVKVSQTGAYRNYATQDRFWNNRDRSLNPPKTIPGNASEHRTGLGFDIWVLDGEKYDYTWFRANCYKYGFILRYPSDKTKITGITYEQWHFRYVGVEAATEINQLGYCLEEYVAYKNGEPLPTSANIPPEKASETTPTPTPTNTPTPTVEPTKQATPTEEPTKQATPTEEPTKQATPTEEPTNQTTPSPDPTVTEEPTVSPSAEATPDPWGSQGGGGEGT